MIIYSIPTATTPYRVELHEIGRDFWISDKKLLENEYIATSTASAGFFRQLVNYGVSSIKKSYSIVIDNARATILQSMMNSSQTSWYISTISGTFHCNLLVSFDPVGPLRMAVTIQISVIEAVS